MELFLDCLPCMHRQALEAAYEATDEPTLHEKIMDDAIRVIADYRRYDTAPALCRAVHDVVKHHTENPDPYLRVKDADIAVAEEMIGETTSFIENAPDPLKAVLKVSATGNVMDSAILKDLDLRACLDHELGKPFARCDLDPLKSELKEGTSILIIGDNAGEGVFDKVIIEHLSRDYHVTFAYRDAPIINDITCREVDRIGIRDLAEVISTGCSAPGAIPQEFSEAFRDIFYSSDVVISKGQGNFEALSDADRTIYFLLKAKCPKIAMALDVEVGDYVFQRKP